MAVDANGEHQITLFLSDLHMCMIKLVCAFFPPTVYLGAITGMATQSGQHSHTSMLDKYNYVFKIFQMDLLSCLFINFKSLILITEQCFLKALANI